MPCHCNCFKSFLLYGGSDPGVNNSEEFKKRIMKKPKTFNSQAFQDKILLLNVY